MASTIAERQNIEVDDQTMSVMHGIRHTEDGEEHVITVPGTDIVVTAPTEEAALEAVVEEIRAVVALRRAADGAIGELADEGEQEDPADTNQPTLLDVSLEEIIRTRAEIIHEHVAAKSAYSRAGSKVNAIGQRIKEIDAELTRRGELILDRRIALEPAAQPEHPSDEPTNNDEQGDGA